MAHCESPQLEFRGCNVVEGDCGICAHCRAVKSNADRARKFYWARKARGGK